MSTEEHEPTHFAVSPSILYGLIFAAFAGGGGVGSFVAPQLDQSTLTACYDNSASALKQAEIALGVTAQHGEEHNELRATDQRLEQLIYDRTRDRWSTTEQQQYERQDARREATQDRRIDYLEKREKEGK